MAVYASRCTASTGADCIKTNWIRVLGQALRVLAPRPEKTKQVGNFASVAVKYAAAMGALLYFSGWLYLYHFYRLFQIDVSMLQLSTQEIILYSALVIQHVTKYT